MTASDEFLLDAERPDRVGLHEAVYCASKSATQIAAILAHAETSGTTLLLTRLDQQRFEALPPRFRETMDYDVVSRTAYSRLLEAPAGPAAVAVVTAGTSDVPVAREIIRTLNFEGAAADLIVDVGVAGLWRLMRRAEELQRYPVVIVVAGMDAALPSVVGGLIPGLVIAVPTSVGYGIAEGGRAALHAALSSCAPGVVVVNIDNGYGAACAALRTLNHPRMRKDFQHEAS